MAINPKNLKIREKKSLREISTFFGIFMLIAFMVVVASGLVYYETHRWMYECFAEGLSFVECLRGP